MKGNSLTYLNIREAYTKWVFTYIFIVLIFRFLGGKYLHDFYDQPIRSIEESYLYWLSLLLYFPHYIIHHYWACVFVDIGVTILPICLWIFPRYSRTLTCLFLAFFWIQTVTVEVFSCSMSKSVVCIFLVVLPILFRFKKFALMVEFARYAGAFILVSSAYFKYVHGALLEPGNYSIALVNQYHDVAIMNPQHFLYQIALFIIDRPLLGDMLYYMLFVSQATFIIAFFTIKFDKILIFNLLMFSVLTYVFMGIYNMDIFILAIPLFFSKHIQQWYQSIENSNT